MPPAGTPASNHTVHHSVRTESDRLSVPTARIRTARLELIAASADVTANEAAGVPDWFVPLGVGGPESWPPPFNDQLSQTWFARRIARGRTETGWLLWYVLRRGDTMFGPVLIGNGGFTGPPDRHGSVELGYSLLPSWHGQGYGTELAGALVTWAFGHAHVARVLAVTYPSLIPSIRVLEKNGFQRICHGSDRTSLTFELRRGVFERRLRAGSLPPSFSTLTG
jgi:[ribosomal protein S5]-alanine N-acetyltransferase